MKLARVICGFILLCVALVLGCMQAEGGKVWFQKRVTWQAGSEPRVWEAAIVSRNGRDHYRLALVPLWAVEGGIVGIEILVARQEHPDANLLGERETGVTQPFVVTVDEFKNGINKSRFGTTRYFQIGHAKLRVEITGSRLGEGVGDCNTCKNIQELTVEFVLKSN